jgi:hypothetical protein
MKNSTVRGARGNLDNVPFEFTRLEQLKSDLSVANMLIALKDLPTIVARGQEWRAKVEAEIKAIEADSLEARTSAEYGQAGEELGTCFIISGGEPFEINAGISIPSWWNSITEEPF